MLPLLAADDPFQHTWNSWFLHFYKWDIDLRAIPGFEALGITNFVFAMIVAALLLLVLGMRAGAEARRAQAEGRMPRGIAHAIEVVVAYIRDDMMRPNMPHHYRHPFFISVFCTFFFFILICNLIGLLPQPFGHTATGSPYVTGALAFGGTLVLIFGAGFWEKGLHYIPGLAPPAPWWIRWPLLWPIEFVGQLVKPFALTIRLFANMTAGHIILAVLSGFLVGLVSFGGSAIAVAVSSAFGFAAITAFEIAISFIQAYIFTVLSTVFVGASLSHEH